MSNPKLADDRGAWWSEGVFAAMRLNGGLFLFLNEQADRSSIALDACQYLERQGRVVRKEVTLKGVRRVTYEIVSDATT